MVTTSSRFKILRCLVLCAGFAVSSPVSVMAQIANLESSEATDPPEVNGFDAEVSTDSGLKETGVEGLVKPRELTFQYLSEDPEEKAYTVIVDDKDHHQKTDKKAKKAKQAKQAKQAKKAKQSCEIFYQGTTTVGSEFTVVGNFSSETLIQIFEDEAAFVAGESAIQTVEYVTETSEATASGAQVGSLTLTSYEAQALTFEYSRTQVTTSSSYTVVTGSVDDDDEAYVVVSQHKGGKCKVGKKAKKAKKCKQSADVFSQDTTSTGGELTEAADCETLVQIFDDDITATFVDVSTRYWASTYIYRLVSVQVIQGFPGGSFRPDDALTYSHFSAIISRAFQVSAVRQAISIRSLSTSYWAYGDIQQAYAMGFIDITDSFSADQSLTKLDVLVAIARGLNYTEVSSGSSVDEILSVFTDASSIPSQYRPYIAALVQRGVLVNYPNVSTLNLNQVISRGETCGLVYQALASLGQVESFSSPYLVD